MALLVCSIHVLGEFSLFTDSANTKFQMNMDPKKEEAIRQLKLMVGSLSSMHRVRVGVTLNFHPRAI